MKHTLLGVAISVAVLSTALLTSQLPANAQNYAYNQGGPYLHGSVLSTILGNQGYSGYNNGYYGGNGYRGNGYGSHRYFSNANYNNDGRFQDSHNCHGGWGRRGGRHRGW